MYKSIVSIVKSTDISKMRGDGVALHTSSNTLIAPISSTVFKSSTHHNFQPAYRTNTIPNVSLPVEVIKLKSVNFQIVEQAE